MKLLVLTAVIACSRLLCAQTVDDIIARNIQARGGLQKLRSLQTVRITARMTVGGFRAAYVQENKRAHKIRQDVSLQGMTQVQAYDGKTAWEIDPFSGRRDPQLLSEDDAKSVTDDADIEGQLVDYKEKGYSAELLGHDSVEGTDCYKIKLTMKNGDVRYYYLDTDSSLELKTETQRLVRGAVEYHESVYGDYEQVNGIYFPFASDNTERSHPQQHVRVTVEKVEVNAPLDDSLFALPVAKPPRQANAGQ